MSRRLFFSFFTALTLLAPVAVFAQEEAAPVDEYFKGTILSIEDAIAEEAAMDPFGGVKNVSVEVEGETIVAQYQDDPAISSDDLQVGERVVVLKTSAFVGETRYVVMDHYRIPSLVWLFVIFVALAVIFASWRGLTAVVGLAISMGILAAYTVPAIARGTDPILVAIISVFAIATISLTISHGPSKQTGIALASTMTTLLLAIGIAAIFVRATHLLGLGTEEAFYLRLTFDTVIDPRGLLLAGIIIGVLGILDDVTTAQTAAVRALYETDKRLRFRELFQKGLFVGREHVVSLVNTLALAYAGVSLPMLLLFSGGNRTTPLWVLFNGELISEEVVRTLIGSASLCLAVPISTLFAALLYSRAHLR